MFSTRLLTLLVLALSVLVPLATAGRPSSRYDPFNQCGAPFCGDTGDAAAGSMMAGGDRVEAGGVVGDNVKEGDAKGDEKLVDKAEDNVDGKVNGRFDKRIDTPNDKLSKKSSKK